MLLALETIIPWRNRFHGRLVVTNGCFDLLHPGHVVYLEAARALGDALLVGLNSDASVRQLKGPTRPVLCETARAAILLALRSVDYVCVFGTPRATAFLALARPDIYVKGGDYSLDTLDPGERQALERAGSEIRFIEMLHGYSTTTLLEKAKG